MNETSVVAISNKDLVSKKSWMSNFLLCIRYFFNPNSLEALEFLRGKKKNDRYKIISTRTNKVIKKIINQYRIGNDILEEDIGFCDLEQKRGIENYIRNNFKYIKFIKSKYMCGGIGIKIKAEDFKKFIEEEGDKVWK